MSRANALLHSLSTGRVKAGGTSSPSLKQLLLSVFHRNSDENRLLRYSVLKHNNLFSRANLVASLVKSKVSELS